MAAITCLVPDLGDHLVVAMVRMQETFAALDDDGTTLPPPLSGEFAIAAVRRVELALTATQTRTHWPAPPGTTFTGPEGQQVVCLRQVELEEGDLRVLASAAQVLGHELAARPEGPLASKISAAADGLWPSDDASPSLTFVATLARLLGLLDVAGTADDAKVVVACIAAAGEHPVVLDHAAYRAYRRLRAHMELFWPTGCQP